MKQNFTTIPFVCIFVYSQELDRKAAKSYLEFKAKYTAWKEQVQIDDTSEIHPWQQFRQPVEGNPKYKVKDTARFKPVHASKFKVKTSPKSIAKAAAKVKLRQRQFMFFNKVFY